MQGISFYLTIALTIALFVFILMTITTTYKRSRRLYKKITMYIAIANGVMWLINLAR